MSAAVAAAAAAACCSSKSRSSSRRSSGQDYNQTSRPATIIRTRPAVAVSSLGNRYEAQKRRDWNMFAQYLSNRPPLSLSRCSGAHVLDFLKHLQLDHDDYHATTATSWSWGSLDALVGRLRAAFEENGGRPESNPFAAPSVRLYLTQLKDAQAQPQRR